MTNPIAIPMRSSTSPKSDETQIKINGSNSGLHGMSMANSDIQMAYTPVPGSIPITAARMADRRESLASGSLMTGISWGPGSVSNWIGKDDIAMQGTSPYIGHNDMKSPMFHSSYLPRLEQSFKLEQEYMQGFKCCDVELPSMHDLLRHFEEKHAGESAFAENLPATSPPVQAAQVNNGLHPQADGSAHRPGPMPSRAQQATPSIQSTMNNMMQQQQQQQQQQPQNDARGQLSSIADMDGMDDLAMDDLNELGGNPFPMPQYDGQTTPRNGIPPLNINPSLQNFQNIRSQPQTPLSARSMYGNNPTVSSVNTPALVANPLHQLQRDSPGSSMPGTPGELDPDFLGAMGSMQFDKSLLNASTIGFAFNNNAAGFASSESQCIDDPGKRLTSPGGPQTSSSKGNDTQDEVHQQLGTTQYGPDSEIAKTIRTRQLEAGMPDQDQPYLCPVIGCMKGYKNSNGLRYHKQHGHKDQALKNNGDGTYSIVDQNGIPYPGTEGMARAKPYACKVCGRRYKNANGLKYHYGHSEGCMQPGQQVNLSDNANVAGAGIVGPSDA